MKLAQSEALVSIVIPVYNAEKTLEKCLESVLMQKYQNTEIILIDDGSADRSAEICKLYQNKYEDKIIYVYKSNGGPSSARNKGIEISKGKYIAFIDSDDAVSPDMISTLVEAAESHGAEMAVCSYYLVENGTRTSCSYKLPEGLYEGKKTEEILHSLLDEDNNSVPPYSYVRLTLRSVFIDNNLRFNNKLIRSEDFHFWMRVHTKLKSVYLLSNTPLYDYISNSNSITHRHVQDYWKGALFIHSDLKKLFTEDSEFNDKLDIMLVKRALIALNNAVMCSSGKQAGKEIRSIVNNSRLNSVIKSLEKKEIKKFKSFRRLMSSHRKFVVVCKYMLENLKYRRSIKKDKEVA